MKDKIAQGLIALLRCGVDQKPLAENGIDLVRSLDLKQLYDLAVKQDLAHIVGHALETNRLLSPGDPVTELFDNQTMLAFFRYKQILYDFERICEAFEETQIPFLPLKGSVIRGLYPEEWMRVSCDIDILVRQEDLEAASAVLKGRLQYRRRGQTVHDLAFYTPNDMHIELHFSLLENDAMQSLTSVLHRVWDCVRPMDGWRYRMEMSPEMFYFYHIAHMAKHVRYGGCGVRFLLDTKILNERLQWDHAACDELLRESGLLTFESYARRLSEAWFGEGEMDENLLVLHQYIMDGGIYGTVENRLANDADATGRNMFRYILGRIFPPPKIILNGYPITNKHKWLVPLFYVIRPFHRLFAGGQKRVKEELQVKAGLSQETVDSVESLLSMLEIDTPDQ